MLYALLYAWLLYSHVVWSVVCTIGIQSRCMRCCMLDCDAVMLYAMFYSGLGYSHVVWSVVCTFGIQSRCMLCCSLLMVWDKIMLYSMLYA